MIWNVIHNMLGIFPMFIPLEPRLTANIPKIGASDGYATDVTPNKQLKFPTNKTSCSLLSYDNSQYFQPLCLIQYIPGCK